jgi:hypothetical protein
MMGLKHKILLGLGGVEVKLQVVLTSGLPVKKIIE